MTGRHCDRRPAAVAMKQLHQGAEAKLPSTDPCEYMVPVLAIQDRDRVPGRPRADRRRGMGSPPRPDWCGWALIAGRGRDGLFGGGLIARLYGRRRFGRRGGSVRASQRHPSATHHSATGQRTCCPAAQSRPDAVEGRGRPAGPGGHSEIDTHQDQQGTGKDATAQRQAVDAAAPSGPHRWPPFPVGQPCSFLLC